MKWFKHRVGGRNITIHLVRVNHPKLEGCDGMYHADECAIYIDRALEPSKRDFILWHELFEHAIDDIAGVSHALESAMPEDEPREQFEEQMVRNRTPLAHALFQDFGGRFPPVPPPRQRKAST